MWYSISHGNMISFDSSLWYGTYLISKFDTDKCNMIKLLKFLYLAGWNSAITVNKWAIFREIYLRSKFLLNRLVIQFAANQRSNKLPQALENCFTAWILMLFVIQQPAIKFDSGFYIFIRGNFNALLTLRGIFWRNVLERFNIKKNLWIEYN